MADPIISDDGRWLWGGKEWVPNPPEVTPTPPPMASPNSPVNQSQSQSMFTLDQFTPQKMMIFFFLGVVLWGTHILYEFQILVLSVGDFIWVGSLSALVGPAILSVVSYFRGYMKEASEMRAITRELEQKRYESSTASHIPPRPPNLP